MDSISRTIRISLVLLLFYPLHVNIQSQPHNMLDTVSAEIYDMGKMWTFDYPPTEYFSKTYHFSPDSTWFNEARLSALRFANYCSASFVSSDGLVMTNHHCARESGTEVQEQGENFSQNGFYATKLEEERVVPGLYVDQLIKTDDITALVQSLMSSDTSKYGDISRRDTAFLKVIREYTAKTGWKGLRLQPIQFYNGAKYSLYGYKRYGDVRLVFMPEASLGFFGGGFDNFTYPRYNLDCSFFRVYDENGNPWKTSHYFKFSNENVFENEPIFVIGNPGRTNRLYTVSDLEFQRDVVLPNTITLIKNRLKAQYSYTKNNRNDSIRNRIFIFENSLKAISGQLSGLRDSYLMARKAAFEKKIRSEVQHNPSLDEFSSVWTKIKDDNALAREIYKTYLYFDPTPITAGKLISFANDIQNYVVESRKNPAEAENSRKMYITPHVNIPEIEEGFLAAYLKELKENFGENDPYVAKALGGKTPEEAARTLIRTTKLNDPQVIASLIKNDTVFINGFNDPLLDLAKMGNARYYEVSEKYDSLQNRLFANRNKLGNLLFKIYGTSISPDATFSLRISDGIVKQYAYNGTIAPPITTFYGMYERYYSFNKQYPWDLPKRWQNPPAKLLPVPFNFITTNDIIGGSSGSPMINKNREVVGLAFDGNIESLPGNFIFMPENNRCVGVTSTGMLNALKYIYKAKRLEKELAGK